jgi:hypothetical protein
MKKTRSCPPIKAESSIHCFTTTLVGGHPWELTYRFSLQPGRNGNKFGETVSSLAIGWLHGTLNFALWWLYSDEVENLNFIHQLCIFSMACLFA